MRIPGEHLGPQQKRQSVVRRLPMSRDLPDSDWQTFRQVREVALERLCKRVLEELGGLIQDASGTYHERYLDVFRCLKERDRELASAFDDPRRSRMLQHLAAIHRLGLLEPDELARFKAGTRTTIEKSNPIPG
jgi:hypothetical protein